MGKPAPKNWHPCATATSGKGVCRQLATTRKLAVIIWNMVIKGVQYINPEGYLFLDRKRKLGIVKRIQKQIAKFELTADDLKIIKT